MSGGQLSPATKRYITEHYVSYGTLAEIARVFDDEGIPCADPSQQTADGSQRRELVKRYLAGVDANNPVHQDALVGVAQDVLNRLSGTPDETKFTQYLVRDGLHVDPSGGIVRAARAVAPALPLGQLQDPSGLHAELARIDSNLHSDPGAAISAAKNLLESTCKLALTELGEAYSDTEDVADLVKKVNKALALHARSVAPTTKGADTVKRLLSNLSTITQGLAELRNAYGTGHGRAVAVAALQPRHAALAVGAAGTWCRFILDTVFDPAAPWRP